MIDTHTIAMVRGARWALVLLMSAMLLTACEKKEEAPPAKPTAEKKAPEQAAQADVAAVDQGEGSAVEPAAADPAAALADPSKATAEAPPTFRARFTTTKGDFVIEATREWAPKGVDRLYNLVRMGYFKDLALFRVVSGFVVQFGIHGDPAVSAVWSQAEFGDDPVAQSNTPGTMVFATAGPDTRTTQIFINLGKNDMLDEMGFAPVAKVIEGMDVVTKFYADYGDGPPSGTGPDQGRMAEEGNAYLAAEYPELDYILQAVIVE